ncbi:hypothetical protein GCM10011586_27180 [Silvibacterium dinghuense]|nr:hypothetical protein GCM10011586_27180 [Silvibacterium dinghuense]
MLGSCETRLQDFTVELPQSAKPEIYRLEGTFQPDNAQNRVIATAPILAISPRKTLRSIQEITGPDVFGTGMIVTNGFTQFFQLATGTSEPWNGWGHPDDLVWAYSRQFKEIPPKARTAANRLYATQSDMRHYSIPWREFSNGEPFFQTSVPGLVQHLKQQNGWKKSVLVRLNFADRWVIGPDLRNCNSWQEYVAFDSYLRTQTGKGLDGRTHTEIENSIHTDHENQWQAWQLGRYVEAVRAIREAFRVEHKDAVIYSQGFPAVAGEPGRELAQTIRGMNDDFTWGMEDNSPNLTTGRTLGSLAFNPVWQVNTMMPWGFVSPVFNNWQWHDPVGTTEPNRRLLHNRIWRGLVWDDGTYAASATYGYTDNVGSPYVLTAEEYQQWWNLQQRGSLLQPESPLGAGLVISTRKNAEPQSTRWNGSDPTALPETRLLMDAFRSLTEAGVSIPFATNASTLASWKPTPSASLIVLNLQDFNSEEIQGLIRVQEQGVRVAAFAPRSSLPPNVAALFSRPGTFLLEMLASGLTHAQALEIAAQLIKELELPISFSADFAGYGFRCQNLNLIVVEDWLEQTREANVRLRKSPGAQRASAANLNDHNTLTVADDGAYWEITVPMRSGDSVLLAIQESR